jgi:plastocyanin
VFEHGTAGIGRSARRGRRGLRAGLIAAAVAVALIQIGPPRAGAAGPADGAVTIKTFQFEPAQLQVATGAKVTWSNTDEIEHTVTAGTPGTKTGLFDSALNGKGTTFSFTFSKAGTYDYFCMRHNFMHGSVVVH